MKTLWCLIAFTLIVLAAGCASPYQSEKYKITWADSNGVPAREIGLPPQSRYSPPFYFRKITNDNAWLKIKKEVGLATFIEVAPYLDQMLSLTPIRVAEGFVFLKSNGCFLDVKIQLVSNEYPPPVYYIATWGAPERQR